MCNAPILAHPLFDRPFILYTDASVDAFAAVLCQVWERKDYTTCNGDVSYDEGSLQEVWTVTMTMTDVECLRLI